MLGSLVRAEVKLVLIQKGSVEDKIPLKVSTSDVALVPKRNFQNAHTLQASNCSDLNVFGLYGVKS